MPLNFSIFCPSVCQKHHFTITISKTPQRDRYNEELQLIMSNKDDISIFLTWPWEQKLKAKMVQFPFAQFILFFFYFNQWLNSLNTKKTISLPKIQFNNVQWFLFQTELPVTNHVYSLRSPSINTIENKKKKKKRRKPSFLKNSTCCWTLHDTNFPKDKHVVLQNPRTL